MSRLSSIVGFVISTSWVGISRLVFIILGGFLMNLAFLFFLPDVCPGEASRCGWSYLLGALFLLGFPILYFFLGQKYAIQKVIHHAYVKNKANFYEYFTKKMTHYIQKKKDDPNEPDSWLDLATNFLDKLDDVPWLLRIVIRFIKARIPFTEVMTKISKDVDLENKSVSQAAVEIAQEADEYIEDDLLEPGSMLLWGAFLLNVGLFVALYLGLPYLF